MPTVATLQLKLNDLLGAYVNGGYFSLRDLRRIPWSSRRFFNEKAAAVSAAHQAFCKAAINQSLPQEIISVEIYAGANLYVRKMMDALSNGFGDELVGAYIHGSLATGEEIEYSDFDALVILRNRVFENTVQLASVASRLYRTSRIMFEADPLQHHGWFVLTEADLPYYCDAYFPRVLFAHSRSLMRDHGLQLVVKPRDCVSEINMAFNTIAASCLRSLEAGHFIGNAYSMKSVLSQFMLLPALYVQAKNGEGIFKKFSFEKARQDFSVEQWQCMDRISELRSQWRIPMSRVLRIALPRIGVLRSPVLKALAPSPPAGVRRIFTPALIAEMTALIHSMRASLAVVRPAIETKGSRTL